MHKEANHKANANSLKAQTLDVEVEDEGGCKCCHCGSAPEDLRSHTYQKMRDHLQQRLKAKSNLSSSTCASSVGSRSSSSTCNVDSSAEVDYLVRFIEGREENIKNNAPNPKKAAKKARQKEKKLEQKRVEELAAKQEALASKKKQIGQHKGGQDKVPNGMVRITHNPLTNSAVITPLYGPIQTTPSYLQQPLSFSQPFKITPPSNPTVTEPPIPNHPTKPSPNPTYTTNSNVTAAASAAPAPSASSQSQPMVTIRRVMQPNVSEPVVTVTLKGETPDNDRVLFTLVNGHVLSSDKSSSEPDTSVQAEATSGAKQSEPATNNAQTRKKQKKIEKRRQKKLLEAANQTNTNQQFISPPQIKPSDPPAGHYNPSQDFSLDNFRLPPGITLTRVQGSHSLPHPDLPVRLVDQPKREPNVPSQNSTLGGPNPIIVTSPLSAPKTKESMAAPNVIVVDTRKMQQQPVTQQQTVRVVQTCSVACQTGEDLDDEVTNSATLTKKQKKKLRRKEKMLEEQAVLDQLAKLQLESESKKSTANKKNTAAISQNAKSMLTQATNSKITSKPSNIQALNGNTANESKASKKKKKKSRAAASTQSSEDKWDESVFVPKADIDLDGGDLDEDERELEAFKRFCFNSVPPERKEKVRINLNVKDIFGRKSNGLPMTSCK